MLCHIIYIYLRARREPKDRIFYQATLSCRVTCCRGYRYLPDTGAESSISILGEDGGSPGYYDVRGSEWIYLVNTTILGLLLRRARM